MSTPQLIPLSLLAPSRDNVRRTRDEATIKDLAANIKAEGLLQNLVAYPDPKKPKSYLVSAGCRRLSALKLLMAAGEIPVDHPVSVLVVDADRVTSTGMSENGQREAMNPADEYQAVQDLVDHGWSLDRIADHFGCTVLHVERRLALAAAAPQLLEEVRAGTMTSGQLMALCASDDHARQIEVWENGKDSQYTSRPEDLRRSVLLKGTIDSAKDDRVKFIGGLAVYAAAGGEIQRDLFSGDGNNGLIQDEALLKKLVADKLEEVAATVRTEGWGWVEAWPKFDWEAEHRMGDAPKAGDKLPKAAADEKKELEKQLKPLQDELEQLEEKEETTHAEEERCEALRDLISPLEDQLEAFSEHHSLYADEVKAKAGAIVAYEYGSLKIYRGKVKTADRKGAAAAGGAEISGGRETEPGKRDPEAMPASLTSSLLAHRNLAAQVEVSLSPGVARVVLAYWAVHQIRDGGHVRSIPSDLNIITQSYNGHRITTQFADEAGAKAKLDFYKGCEKTVSDLPKSGPALWARLREMNATQDDALDVIIAQAVAWSVSLTGNDEIDHLLMADLDLDMAEHFTPTADNYFSKLPKPLIIDALADSGKDAGDPDVLAKMKKGELATLAEKHMVGTGWLPELLRGPKPKPAKKPAPKKAAAKKPAKAAPVKKKSAKAKK